MKAKGGRRKADVTGARFASAAMLIAILAGCDYFLYTPVKDIVATPLKFEGVEVKIKGRVTELMQLPLIETKAYSLQDGDAKIVVVVTQGQLPAVGDQVKLKGTVKSTMIVNGKAVGQRVDEGQRLR